MAKRQSPGKGGEITTAQERKSVAGRILSAVYQVPIDTYRRMINSWKGMTLAQKIGWTVGFILFISYPLIVWIHFTFLRQTF